MNHKKKTIERLRNLNAERAALVNLPEKIRSLEDRYVAIDKDGNFRKLKCIDPDPNNR